MNEIFEKIIEKIEKGDEISPFLFISKNLEILNEEIKLLSYKIFEKYSIPKVFLYVFEDKNEKIKVQEIKKFVEIANIASPHKIQIFFIQNIQNLTIGASNNLLKFFEEPWKQNLIFLSAKSENFILDTILSRVQTVYFSAKQKDKSNNFFQDLIKNYLKNEDSELLSYFFKTKLEKDDYLERKAVIDKKIKLLESKIIILTKNITEDENQRKSINSLKLVIEKLKINPPFEKMQKYLHTIVNKVQFINDFEYEIYFNI